MLILVLQGTAQRVVASSPCGIGGRMALGRAWTLLRSRKKTRSQKMLAVGVADWESEPQANIVQSKRLSAELPSFHCIILAIAQGALLGGNLNLEAHQQLLAQML